MPDGRRPKKYLVRWVQRDAQGYVQEYEQGEVRASSPRIAINRALRLGYRRRARLRSHDQDLEASEILEVAIAVVEP